MGRRSQQGKEARIMRGLRMTEILAWVDDGVCMVREAWVRVQSPGLEEAT